MKKKISLYFSFVFLAINIVNGNLSKLYFFVRQRITINTISPEIIKICDPLQAKIDDYISEFENNISISVLNDNGEFIIDVNSFLPRIPASNQKLLSSAFAIDTLGPHYTLNTSLKRLSNGDFYIEAFGDPDFDGKQLVSLVSELKNIKYDIDKKVPIIIKKSSYKWWPSTWSLLDRKEDYGAPITKYSIASNSSIKALNNPISNFIDNLEDALQINKIADRYFVRLVNKNYPIDYSSSIVTNYSAPLYILLNLVNSESHNFTSEVIFRNALDNWSHNFPNIKYSKWLKRQNFNTNKFVFADASGLSRENRVTTYGLSQFLRRMKNNRYGDYYFSSFSVLGIRGSLASIPAPLSLKGKILAKSGTLTNVRSISGVILSNDLFFSIIVNDMNDSLKYIIDILSIIDKDKICT